MSNSLKLYYSILDVKKDKLFNIDLLCSKSSLK